MITITILYFCKGSLSSYANSLKVTVMKDGDINQILRFEPQSVLISIDS